MTSSYHQEYMQNLQNKINFLNQLEKSKSKSTFDYNNTGYRNTFYNDQENGKISSRPNKPSDYTTQAQRIENSRQIINTSNQYISNTSKSLGFNNTTTKSTNKNKAKK